MSKLLSLLHAAGVPLSSPVGRWMQSVSQLLDGGGGPAASGGCCIPGVIFGNVGSTSEVIPLPAGCTQPDTNYVITGVFTGGDLSANIEFAIVAKGTNSFTIGFEPGVPVGGLQMDFRLDRC